MQAPISFSFPFCCSACSREGGQFAGEPAFAGPYKQEKFISLAEQQPLLKQKRKGRAECIFSDAWSNLKMSILMLFSWTHFCFCNGLFSDSDPACMFSGMNVHSVPFQWHKHTSVAICNLCSHINKRATFCFPLTGQTTTQCLCQPWQLYIYIFWKKPTETVESFFTCLFQFCCSWPPFFVYLLCFVFTSGCVVPELTCQNEMYLPNWFLQMITKKGQITNKPLPEDSFCYGKLNTAVPDN